VEKLYRRLSIAHHIEAAGDAAVLYRRRIGALVRAVLMTFGAHVALISSIALIGASLSLHEIPLYSYFLFVPLIYICGAVPISPGGMGVMEYLYVLFFAPMAGVSGVVALALIARLIPIFWGLPGAVVAVTGPKLPKAETIEAELGLAEGSPA
jgi:uncharacterized membrane protein YbhN (UPF0104 family)